MRAYNFFVNPSNVIKFFFGFMKFDMPDGLH